MVTILQYPDEEVSQNQQGSPRIAVLVDELGNPVKYDIGISCGVKSWTKKR
jgi:outer membrane biosynthesis protein TonB